MKPTSSDDRVVFNIRLNVAGEDSELELAVPNAHVRVADLLPLFQGLVNFFVEAGVRSVSEKGRTVSCRAGCGACCRQMVPVSESEAIRLAEFVEDLPTERRERVQERFQRTVETFDERGMLDRLETIRSLAPEERTRFGIEYFHGGIPCPFLDEESCSIHEDRPLACREYLVTSPRELCARPEDDALGKVPLPLYLSRLIYRFEDGKGDDEPRWLPLVLALRWAGEAENRQRPSYPAPQLISRFLEMLTVTIKGSEDEST